MFLAIIVFVSESIELVKCDSPEVAVIFIGISVVGCIVSGVYTPVTVSLFPFVVIKNTFDIDASLSVVTLPYVSVNALVRTPTKLFSVSPL